MIPPKITPPNLVSNPGFQSGMTSWENLGNSQVTTSGGYHSTAALLVGPAVGGAGQDVTSKLTPGQYYRLSAFAKMVGTGTEWAGIGLKFWKGNALVGDVTVQVTSTVYQRFSLAFQAPPSDVVDKAAVYAWKDAGARTLMVDAFELVSGAVDPPTAPGCIRSFYVKPTGNDSLDGRTVANAWQTIAHVNAQDLAPRECVFFEGGKTFSGTLVVGAEDSGTPTSPVRFARYGTGRATISSGNAKGLDARNAAGLYIANLAFLGSGRLNNTTVGISLYTDLPSTKLQYLILHNLDVSGYGNRGISIVGAGSLTTGFEDIRITQSDVHDNGDAGIFVGGYNPTTSGYAHQSLWIAGCRVFLNAGKAGVTGRTGNGIIVGQTQAATISTTNPIKTAVLAQDVREQAGINVAGLARRHDPVQRFASAESVRLRRRWVRAGWRCGNPCTVQLFP